MTLFYLVLMAAGIVLAAGTGYALGRDHGYARGYSRCSGEILRTLRVVEYGADAADRVRAHRAARPVTLPAQRGSEDTWEITGG